MKLTITFNKTWKLRLIILFNMLWPSKHGTIIIDGITQKDLTINDTSLNIKK